MKMGKKSFGATCNLVESIVLTSRVIIMINTAVFATLIRTTTEITRLTTEHVSNNNGVSLQEQYIFTNVTIFAKYILNM
jgi:hypothetical protein